jgi:hypothetical protein
MYLNAYVPQLQYESGVAAFFRHHRGQPFASSALMEPISKAFVAAIHGFVAEQRVPLITFEKGQWKDDVMAERLTRFTAAEGVGRRNAGTPRPAKPILRLVRSTAMVNHFYFYAVDRDFGPFFSEVWDLLPLHRQAMPPRVREAPTQRGIACEALGRDRPSRLPTTRCGAA